MACIKSFLIYLVRYVNPTKLVGLNNFPLSAKSRQRIEDWVSVFRRVYRHYGVHCAVNVAVKAIIRFVADAKHRTLHP
jgi:hypothetical protein